MTLSLGTVASVYVQRPNLEVEELCVQSAGCVSVEPLSQLGLVVWMGILIGVATVAIAQLRDARAALDTERTRTTAERDAFARFARRVDAIEGDQARTPSASGSKPSGAPGNAATIGTRQHQQRQQRQPSQGLREVRNAYRETVMAVDHYEEEYDEALRENLAAEFGEEVATAVCETPQLTPPLQRALLGKSREAYDERVRLLDTLDEEGSRLAAARERLTDLEMAREEVERDVLERPSTTLSFPEVYRAWHRLRDLEVECEEFLDDRQRFVHETGTFGTFDATDFYGYLYDSIEATYPVLVAGTSLCDRLRAAQRRAGKELTRHV